MLFTWCKMLWSRNIEMGINREIGKDNARLYKVDSRFEILFEVLYSTIHNYKGAGDREIKNKMSLRARRYEKIIKLDRAGKIAKKCWQEKEQYERNSMKRKIWEKKEKILY